MTANDIANEICWRYKREIHAQMVREALIAKCVVALLALFFAVWWLVR